MDFKTEVKIPALSNSISYESKILSLGSCFATNMGQKLAYFSFDVCTNPFGIIFNPESILNLIARALENRFFEPSDSFYHNELWHCFEVHSSLSQPTQEDLIEKLNEKLLEFRNHLVNSSHLIITLGTSWVYKNNNQTVANCHKVPNKNFEKVLLSVTENQLFLDEIVSKVSKVNPNMTIIWTISPVRHQKDGFVENQRSKAHLISACQNLIHDSQLCNHYYFPSYELMMDELRDYRFYERDMLHPNQLAIDFIWEKFLEKAIDTNAYNLVEEVGFIRKSLAHKPINPDSKAHQVFVNKLNARIHNVKDIIPNFQTFI